MKSSPWSSKCGVLIGLCVLAACGGGGDSTDAVAAPPAAAPVPAPAPGPAPGPAPAALSTCGLPAFGTQLLQRINSLRASGASCGARGRFAPAAPLAWNPLLVQAADGHARDMAAKNYFSHTSLDGRSMSDRVDATGYAWRSLGENIAAGQRSVDAVMDGWAASDGHCANLMDADFTAFGVACAPAAAGSRYPNYWTMNLARPR